MKAQEVKGCKKDRGNKGNAGQRERKERKAREEKGSEGAQVWSYINQTENLSSLPNIDF